MLDNILYPYPNNSSPSTQNPLNSWVQLLGPNSRQGALACWVWYICRKIRCILTMALQRQDAKGSGAWWASDPYPKGFQQYPNQQSILHMLWIADHMHVELTNDQQQYLSPSGAEWEFQHRLVYSSLCHTYMIPSLKYSWPQTKYVHGQCLTSYPDLCNTATDIHMHGTLLA